MSTPKPWEASNLWGVDWQKLPSGSANPTKYEELSRELQPIYNRIQSNTVQTKALNDEIADIEKRPTIVGEDAESRARAVLESKSRDAEIREIRKKIFVLNQDSEISYRTIDRVLGMPDIEERSASTEEVLRSRISAYEENKS